MKQLFAATLVLCAMPALLGASPDTTKTTAASVPMSIGDCHLDYTPGGLLPLSKTVGPLHVTFTNQTKQAIVEAKFDVNLDGNHIEIKDVGSYAPDVEIKKQYRQLGGGEHFLFSREAQPTCSLAMAKFADGSVWSAPVAATSSASRDPSGFTQFVGSWNCSTAAGSSVQMTFSAKDGGSFAAGTTWKNGGASGTFEHAFTPQPDGSWKTTQVDGAKALVFDGSSPGFADQAITFTGTEHAGSASVPERETLRVTSPSTFEHTWYRADSAGAWQPTSFTECTKV